MRHSGRAAVEAVRPEVGRPGEQLALAAWLGQRGAGDVRGDVEALVGHPRRPVQAAGGAAREPLAIARERVEARARGGGAARASVGVPPPGSGSKTSTPSDVHVRRDVGLLELEEGRVEWGERLGRRHALTLPSRRHAPHPPRAPLVSVVRPRRSPWFPASGPRARHCAHGVPVAARPRRRPPCRADRRRARRQPDPRAPARCACCCPPATRRAACTPRCATTPPTARCPASTSRCSASTSTSASAPTTRAASAPRWTRELAGIPIGRREALDGAAADPEAEAARYEAVLDTAPVDLAVLGLGRDAHVAFNEPGLAARRRRAPRGAAPVDHRGGRGRLRRRRARAARGADGRAAHAAGRARAPAHRDRRGEGRGAACGPRGADRAGRARPRCCAAIRA